MSGRAPRRVRRSGGKYLSESERYVCLRTHIEENTHTHAQNSTYLSRYANRELSSPPAPPPLPPPPLSPRGAADFFISKGEW